MNQHPKRHIRILGFGKIISSERDKFHEEIRTYRSPANSEIPKNAFASSSDNAPICTSDDNRGKG